MSMFTDMTGFLGWCTLINLVILSLTAFMLITMRRPLLKIHGKMLGMGEKDLLRLYVQFLAGYKVLWLFFNLAPYLALRFAG